MGFQLAGLLYAVWLLIAVVSMPDWADGAQQAFTSLMREGKPGTPLGLDEFRILALLSHQSYLYAATVYADGTREQRNSGPGAIYHATIPRLQTHGKAITTGRA